MTGKESGLTLIELLIVLTIISISLFSIAPSFSSMMDQIRGYQALQSFRTTLILARSEAIKRNRMVRICPSDNGVTCNESLYWQNGWIIYVAGNSIYRQENDEILHRSLSLKRLIIRKNGNEKTVLFKPNGGIGLGRSFSLCSDNGEQLMRRIVLSRTGRIRLDNDQVDCT